MILIVSRDDDVDTGEVIDRLSASNVVLVDMADIPMSTAVSLSLDDSTGVERSLLTDDGEVDLDDVRVIWWRRARRHVIDSEIGAHDERAFAEREVSLATGGLLDGLDCAWINHWAADEAAQRKPLQWVVARSIGLKVPASLVTNDPTRANEFIEAIRPRDCVYKSLLAPLDWRETRLLQPSDTERIDDVSYCPVIFQEYVPGIDFRVTIVGRHVFTTMIDASATEYPYDMRPVFGESVVEAADLPIETKQRCRQLLKRLHLTFGAIDLRQHADTGEFYFLEVNPAGSWSFIEKRTSQPISEAVADELTRLDGRTDSTPSRNTSTDSKTAHR